jgi:hypothetical protein
VYLSILLSPTWVVAGEQDNAAAMKEQKWIHWLQKYDAKQAPSTHI